MRSITRLVPALVWAPFVSAALIAPSSHVRGASWL